ncbi:hypothetical protein GZH49_02950 [Nocardia terpenica]|uniref:hypothetical protein n=1 Tax=Nocardia terpenica TaxID=455432 RepID=UPI002FE2F34A
MAQQQHLDPAVVRLLRAAAVILGAGIAAMVTIASGLIVPGPLLPLLFAVAAYGGIIGSYYVLHRVALVMRR